jgi:2-dehydropantoate 2-reductase
VLPVLNGRPRAAALSRKLPTARLFEACIYVASRRVEPGIIEQQSPFCRIVLQGAFEAAGGAEAAVCAFLEGSGVTCTVTTSIAEEMWTKFLFVCPMAGVTSLHERTFDEVLDDPLTRDLLTASMSEIATLAAACGAPLGPEAVARALDTAASFPPSARTSMQNDFADGRPTELEAFSGAVLRLAERHGVGVPAHRAIYEGLRARGAKDVA